MTFSRKSVVLFLVAVALLGVGLVMLARRESEPFDRSLHVKSLGMAIALYQCEHRGEIPDTIARLVAGKYLPKSVEQELDGNCVFLGGHTGSLPIPPYTIIAYDRPAGSERANLLLQDGTIVNVNADILVSAKPSERQYYVIVRGSDDTISGIESRDLSANGN